MKQTLLAVFLITSSFLSASAQQDWATDIAPILYNKCTSCHRPGGIGPFSLLTYQDAYDNAYDIESAVSNGSMPPWTPDTTFQRYAHERTLSAQEISAIQQWVNNGMPSGNLVNAPNPPVYNQLSQLDSVSISLRIPTFTVSNNNDVYRNFVLPSGLSQAAYATAMEIVPGNTAIVHHVLVFHDSTTNPISTNSAGGTGSSASQLIFGYTPGASPSYTPVGTGFRLPANTRIILQMHYAPGSLGQVDSTRINIKLSNGNLRNISVNALLNHYPPSLTNGPLSIPANTIRSFDEQFQVFSGNYTLLYAFPHMHLIGQSIQAYGLNPSTNDTIPFVRINDWDFHWQDNFIFRNAIKVPNLTTFRAHATYDNTINNPDNPSSPPVDVSLGESTLDEMMLVFFAYLPYQTGDENLIVDKRIHPSGNTDICSGQTIYLRAIQGNGYSYQWYRNGSMIGGATGFEYAATLAGAYTVSISLGGNTVVSDPISVNVSNPSVSTVTPSGFNPIPPADSLLLTAGSGNGFTYQWYLNGTAIQGATGSSYSASAEGDYTVMINNGGCFSQSPVSTVSFLNTSIAPTITEDPSIVVYPNPARGPITVETTCPTQLMVFDVKGRLVTERSLAAGKNELQLNVTGTYLLEFSDSTGRQTQRRITVQR